MLQQHCGSHGIHITLPATSGTTHLTHASERSGRRVTLIHITHRQARPLQQCRAHHSHLGAARRLLTGTVKRESKYEARGLQLGRAARLFGLRRIQ